MKDYLPFCLRILFLRRFLAAYLSLTLLGLGAGIGRAEEKKLFFNTPPKHELKLACTPVPKSDNPVVQQLLEQIMGKPAVEGPDNAAQPAAAEHMQPLYKDFSLAAKPGQNSFSLARQAENNPFPVPNYLPQKPLVGLTDISILVETPIPKARSTEPLVKIYQTLPWDMMPNALGKGAKDDQAAEKKSPWWKWPAIIVGAAVVGVGAYELFFKKKTNPVIDNKPVQVTLNFDVYKYPTGFVTTITKQAMSNSSVSIAIGDTGVDNVDSSYFLLYDGNSFKANGTSGSISFTAPNTTTPNTTKNYNVVLLPKLVDLTGNSPGVSYSWMANAKLYAGTRNFAPYRKDWDNQTGPEGSWTSVWSQLRAPLSLSWLKLGSITEKPMPNDGTGTFSYGYAICVDSQGNRVDGINAGSYIKIDPERLHNDPQSFTAVGLAEAFENIISFNNIGGKPSSMTIQFQGVLNDTGRALLAYVFLKDGTPGIEFNPASGSAAKSNSAVNLGKVASEISTQGAAKARNGAIGRKGSISDMMYVVPMLAPMNIEGKVGSLAFGADPLKQKLYARLGNQSSGIAGELVNAGSLTDWIGRANAFANYGRIAGSFDLVKGAGNEMARATVSADVLDNLAVGLSNLYQNGVNSVNVHIAALHNSDNSNVLGFTAGSTTGNGMRSQRYAAALNLGGAVVVDGTYQKFSQNDVNLALSLSAKLGRAVILGSYSQQMYNSLKQSCAQAAFMMPIGPGLFDLGWSSVYGPRIAISMSIPITQ
jgi:hypothetical protein